MKDSGEIGEQSGEIGEESGKNREKSGKNRTNDEIMKNRSEVPVYMAPNRAWSDDLDWTELPELVCWITPKVIIKCHIFLFFPTLTCKSWPKYQKTLKLLVVETTLKDFLHDSIQIGPTKTAPLLVLK